MRILIIEDEPEWQAELKRVAEQATFRQVECLIAASLQAARRLIADHAFALIFVDLSIPLQDGDREESDDNGMTVLQELRADKLNREAACLVMTAHGTSRQTREALKELNIQDFLDKSKFAKSQVVELTRRALFAAARSHVERIEARKFDLTFVLTNTHCVFAQLSGPERFRDVIPEQPMPFEAEEAIRRANRIERFVTGELRRALIDEWRTDVHDTGVALYQSLFGNPALGNILSAANFGPQQPRDLRLCFRGARKSLAVPFELLHDKSEYLALNYPLVRQITSGEASGRKALSFRNLLAQLEERGETLNVLLLASNVGPNIEAADREVVRLKTLLDEQLAEAGIRRAILALSTAEASYTRVESLLREKKWHVIHYAGHGLWNHTLPEDSALVFRHNGGPRAMPASVLSDLMKNSAALLFFLSGCLGARTADHPERGDLYGLMDGLVQADVPMVLGHRWSVSDGAATDLALAFYTNLFSTWSVEDALFEARQAVIRESKYHRDDPGWASPVLVAQARYHRG
ncbi:MAG TPA: CHAT domain-containing protein [Anaerolineae bacterium]|nr:CHAT domain-containing protein [Anaerolineae bacterium]